VTFEDGVYDLSDLNTALRDHLTSEGFSAMSFTFYSNAESDKLVVDIIQRGFLLDFTASTISDFLGVKGTLPADGSFVEQHTPTSEKRMESSLNPQILATHLVQKGNWTGEGVVKSVAGHKHTLVQTYNSVSHLTRIWGFGSNLHGQLGCKYNAYTEGFNGAPCLINSYGKFVSWNVRDMFAGGTHSAVLDKNMRVFLFGSDSHGQLGSGKFDRAATFLPRMLESIGESLRFTSVFLGLRHTIVTGRLTNSTASRAWAFGSNEWGQLGSDESQFSGYSNPIPLEILPPANQSWTDGCAGNFHTMLISNEHQLWVTGNNNYGQCGVTGDVSEIRRLSNMYPAGSILNDAREILSSQHPFTSLRVSHVACGGDHSLVVTDDGKLWSMGLNMYGQLVREDNLALGNSNSNPTLVPDRMLASDGIKSQPVIGVRAAGDNSIIQTSRQQCLDGYYSPDGLQPCYHCEAGKYSNSSGAMQCAACSKGFFSPAASDRCFPCEQGSYSDENGLGACKACPVNKPYTAHIASMDISKCVEPCDAGYMGSFGTQPCTICSPGKYSAAEASTACTECEVGKYQQDYGASFCSACPNDQSTRNISSFSATDCRKICSPGYYGASGLAESEFNDGIETRRCKACSKGHFSKTNRSHECQLCALDSYQYETGQSTCVMCPDGKGTEDPGSVSQDECLPFCQPGTISSTGVETCRACEAGKFSGAVGQKQCFGCPPGSYSIGGSSSCSQCLPGTFSLANSSYCTLCPLGEYQSLSGQSSCIPCPRRQFADNLGSSNCTACPDGLDTTETGSSAESDCAQVCAEGTFSSNGLVEQDRPCQNCIAGTASESLGQTAWPLGCLNCTPGYYSGSASPSCQACSPGTYSTEFSATACLNCSVGSSSVVGSTSCSPCLAGSYADIPGLQQCLDCPEGSYQSNEGASSCELCPLGSSSSERGSTVGCSGCIRGKYSNVLGMTACLECQVGSFSTGNASNCSLCQPGLYAAQNQSVQCFLCEIGTFSSTAGASICESCSPGFAAASGSASCNRCKRSFWSDGSMDACVPCPGGFNTTLEGSKSQSDCLKICRPGQFGSLGLSQAYDQHCVECERGKFSSRSYSSSCDSCEPGSYAPATGMQACLLCAPGTFASIYGSQLCSECGNGEYTQSEGATQCSLCPGGKYMDENKATACKVCGFGAYSAAGASACQTCPALTSTALSTSTSVDDCIPFCEPGFYGVENGVASSSYPCQKCGPGTFNNFSKQSACFLCPRGKFTGLTGAFACKNCPLDTWQNETGSTSCNACPTVDQVCDTCPFNLTRTRFSGAEEVSKCRLYSQYECLYSPRRWGKYPVYAAGDNWYGQSVEDLTTVGAQIKPFLIPCETFGKEEVAQVRSSGKHSIALTAEWTPSYAGRFRTRMWSWGLNSHGQLGTSTGVGTFVRNPTPGLVPGTNFPDLRHGNTVSQSLGNNKFRYLVWDQASGTTNQFSVTVPDNVYSADELSKAVSAEIVSEHAHPAGIFEAQFDPETKSLIFQVTKPGFQADFTMSDTIGENFGFSIGERFPPQGTLNEVSARAKNNFFRYRHWCAPFPACGQNYSTFSLTFLDGLYTTEELFEQVSIFTMNNGHGKFAFLFGLENDHAYIDISEKGLQVDFTGEDTIANFLGFERKPYPASGPTDSEVRVNAESVRGNLNVQHLKPLKTTTSLRGQDPQDFAIGGKHTLVLTTATDGISRLWAFGSNRYGQLGTNVNAGNELPNLTPHLIPEFDEQYGGKRVIRFEAGEHHSMVETADGSLWVFGSNRYGQLGLPENAGTQQPNWSPTVWNSPGRIRIEARIILLSDWTAGGFHSLVLLTNGDLGENIVLAFGSNEFGQLAHRGALNVDASTTDLSTLPSTAGLCHSSQSMGVVTCRSIWDSDRRRTNIIPVSNHVPLPVVISDGDVTADEVANLDIVQVRAGGKHSIVKTRDGRVWCAGSNMFGQCGAEINPSFDASALSYPPYGNQQHVLKLVGFQYAYAQGSVEPQVTSPDAACCRPRDPRDNSTIREDGTLPDCTCRAGFWSFAGTCIPCPFGGILVKEIIAANAHSIVQTIDGKAYSFGLNSGGQLLRWTENIDMLNANPGITAVEQIIFGDSNQPFYDIESGSTADHTFAQTLRPFCAPGNHSIDRRSPCDRCVIGSFTASKGTLTGSFYSFDQSVGHPHSTRYNVTWQEPIFMNCKACRAGTFSTTNASFCNLCPAGKYSFDGASTCHDCPLGTYSGTDETANCTLCAKGKSSLVGQTACFDCGLGEYANILGLEKCLKCDIGKYTPSFGTIDCFECDPTSYQNTTGSSACVQCPLSKPTTARLGATELWMCQQLCPAGTSGDRLGTSTAAMVNCRPCPSGFYGWNDFIPGGSGALACRPCKPGSYSPKDGSEAISGAPLCTICAGGKFSNQYATVVCQGCPPATFSPSNSIMCYNCPPGKYSLGDQENCTRCDPGQFNPSYRSDKCYDCNPGKFSGFLGSSSCFNCSAGSFSKGRASICTLCSPGFYQNFVAQTECFECSAGTFSRVGVSVCLDCQPGNFSWGVLGEGRGATECQMCPAGKYSSFNATSNCSLCSAGSFGPVPMLSICKLCNAGFFSPSMGYSACLSCTLGFFSRSNFSSCVACAPGSYANTSNAIQCLLCDPGSFANTNNASTCLSCFPGSYNNKTGSSACQVCNEGTVSGGRATACQDCIPGTIAPRPRMQKCELCDVGNYIPIFRGVECLQCPMGKSTQGLGAGTNSRPIAVPEYFNSLDSCRPYCQAGKFSIWGVRPLGYNSECTPCPLGYYSGQNASITCLACPSGTYSKFGASVCTSCDPGKYSGPAQSECQLCRSGTFAAYQGMSACVKCGSDTYSLVHGSTICTLCHSMVSPSTALYFKDCRQPCSGFSPVDTSGGALSSGNCCMNAPMLTIELANGAYSVEALETSINSQVRMLCRDLIECTRTKGALSHIL
jgi:alpha-tubulin suppressor-like RCC1 family protein